MCSFPIQSVAGWGQVPLKGYVCPAATLFRETRIFLFVLMVWATRQIQSPCDKAENVSAFEKSPQLIIAPKDVA